MASTERASDSGFAGSFSRLADAVEHVIQGKREVIELVLVCLVARGHLLIEDVPGVGKTTLAKSLAAAVGGSFGRIQFTPDLLPTDVVGMTVWNRTGNTFDFHPGPVFNNVVLADEINRASPKTQSALLEAMAEHQVTVDGTTYGLPSPFLVIATQNPVEHEGTYPLPESQLDRFFMLVAIGYPTPGAELAILDRHGGLEAPPPVHALGSPAELEALSAAAAGVHVAAPLRRYLVDLAGATRRHPSLALGMSPRATLAVQRAGRVLAAANGRDYVVPDDVRALIQPVVAHRLAVTPDAAMAGETTRSVLDEILAAVPIPSAPEQPRR